MSVYFTVLSILAAFVSVTILLWCLKEGEIKEIKKYTLIGGFSVAIDLIVEYLGTSTGGWDYHHSLYAMFNLVPVELMVIFFGAGIGLRFTYLHLKNLSFSLNIDKILYLLLVLTFSYYVIWTYQGGATLLPFATVFGMWGILKTSEENRNLALSIAALAFVTNFVAEMLVISSGGYTYIQGFSISISMIYAFFTLGFIGLIEYLEDRF